MPRILSVVAAVIVLSITASTAQARSHKTHSSYSNAKPAKWCGWFMRQKVPDPGPRFNLARSWASYGSPSSPGPGVIVVWAHHVGVIVGRASNGEWIIHSGNDGGAVRTRPRSVARAIAFRLPPTRIAGL